VITGNEDGIKHTAMTLAYALSHLGYSIPPRPQTCKHQTGFSVGHADCLLEAFQMGKKRRNHLGDRWMR